MVKDASRAGRPQLRGLQEGKLWPVLRNVEFFGDRDVDFRRPDHDWCSLGKLTQHVPENPDLGR
jgi:hypothetical protein